MHDNRCFPGCMRLIRLRSRLYCQARSVQVGWRLEAMSSLPKIFGGDERLVIFPCKSFNEMDRFLLSINSLDGELTQDVLVGEQILQTGFLCGWGLQGTPASRADRVFRHSEQHSFSKTPPSAGRAKAGHGWMGRLD